MTPTQKRIQAAIERKAAREESITVRGVQTELHNTDGRGSSFTAVTPLVRSWNHNVGNGRKNERSVDVTNRLPKSPMRISPAVTRAIGIAITEIVTAVQAQDAEVITALRGEVSSLTCRIEAAEANLVRQSGMIEDLSRRLREPVPISHSRGDQMKRAPQRNKILTAETDDQSVIKAPHALQATLSAYPASKITLSKSPADQLVPVDCTGQSKAAAKAFNHSVVLEIAPILQIEAELQPQASLSAHEIIERLPKEVVARIAERKKRPIIVADIHEILRNRVDHKRYVRRVSRGRYAFFPDWQEQKRERSIKDSIRKQG